MTGPDRDPGQRIALYISSRLATGLSEEEIGLDTPLLEDGLIQSLQLLDLVLFLEREFGARIPAHELGVERFSSIRSVLALLESLGAEV